MRTRLGDGAEAPAIELDRVSRHWGATVAVRELSFVAEPGRLLVLLGPSGCGKSTSLRLIAGLEPVSAGHIRIGGRDVTALPAGRRSLSMVFQSYALFPHLSVEENIVFGLRLRKVARAERARRLARVAGILGIAPLLARRPGQLSGGQQQRVALARALVAEAPICLMDEPLSNLDAQLRAEMRREIRELQQRLGITMVYVTHDQVEAMTMADRVVLMRAGAVEQNAPPAELYESPASVFAARFIGTPPMNILDLAPGPGGAVLRGADEAVPIRADPAATQLGLRPEAVRIDAEGGVPARLVGIEFLGADSLATCALGQGAAAQRLILRAPGRLALAPGAALRLAWPDAAAHFFGADGRRIAAPTARPLAVASGA